MKVQVCNIRELEFPIHFKKSLMETGFAVITHHGIDHGLIKDIQQEWREFFTNSLSYKEEFANKDSGNQGYKGMMSEKAVGAKVADLKEFYHWRPGGRLPLCTWQTPKMFAQLEDIGLNLLRVIDFYNGFNTDYTANCENSDNTILRTIYYPALKDCNAEGAVRSAAHEDINFITLLVAATAPGLQVLDKKGNWHEVPYEENSLVCNVGDMLALASNGLYKSTTHRVVNPNDSSSDRISLPLFIHPHSNTILREDGFTAKQYLEERINQIYTKK